MKRFDLSTRQARELARGVAVQLAIPAQPGAGRDPLAYAQAVLPEVRSGDIESAEWGEVWVALRRSTGALGELVGDIVAADSHASALIVSVVVCLATLSPSPDEPRRAGAILPVQWPGAILDSEAAPLSPIRRGHLFRPRR
jgi:hypothetical protein